MNAKYSFMAAKRVFMASKVRNIRGHSHGMCFCMGNRMRKERKTLSLRRHHVPYLLGGNAHAP